MLIVVLLPWVTAFGVLDLEVWLTRARLGVKTRGQPAGRHRRSGAGTKESTPGVIVTRRTALVRPQADRPRPARLPFSRTAVRSALIPLKRARLHWAFRCPAR